MPRPRLISTWALLLIVGGASHALALDGAAIIAENCVSCHDVTGPGPSTIKALMERKGPDLFYAGSKFKKAWLVEWIQNPTQIRPSGVMFLNHIVTEDGKDQINADSVESCQARLGPMEAAAVADHLMTLTDPAMQTGVIDPKAKLRKSKATTLFTKKLPCLGCHMAKIGKVTKGGVSGPDLTQAGSRLNPDWTYALIDNPQHWNPMTSMPSSSMSDKNLDLLTKFIAAME